MKKYHALIFAMTLSSSSFSQDLEKKYEEQYLTIAKNYLIHKLSKASYNKYLKQSGIYVYRKDGDQLTFPEITDSSFTHVVVAYKLDVPEFRYSYTLHIGIEKETGRINFGDSIYIPRYLIGNKPRDLLNEEEVTLLLKSKKPSEGPFKGFSFLFDEKYNCFVWYIDGANKPSPKTGHLIYDHFLINAKTGEILQIKRDIPYVPVNIPNIIR